MSSAALFSSLFSFGSETEGVKSRRTVRTLCGEDEATEPGKEAKEEKKRRQDLEQTKDGRVLTR
jgi:hypothetical protein